MVVFWQNTEAPASAWLVFSSMTLPETKKVFSCEKTVSEKRSVMTLIKKGLGKPRFMDIILD
jgi:hypothetical protein